MRTRASDRTGPRPAEYIGPGGRVIRGDKRSHTKVRPIPAVDPCKSTIRPQAVKNERRNRRQCDDDGISSSELREIRVPVTNDVLLISNVAIFDERTPRFVNNLVLHEH